MDINRNNYESFFMDYLDGKMSPDQVIKLMSFLKENPDLKTELEEFEEINVEPDKKRFESKISLKKAFIVNDSNFDNLCIASLEGDLNEEETTLLQNWLQQNPLKVREFELYKKTRLIPEKNTFDYKSTLKKSSIVRILTPKVWGYFSAAASITILITLYLFISRPNTNENTVISQIITSRSNNIVEKPVITQDVNIVSDKSNRLITPDAIELTLNKIRLKGINTLPEKPILASLVSVEYLEVVENIHNNLTLSQMAVKSFKSEILKEEKSKIDPDKFTLWDIADAGIRGVNKIIGWKMELDKEYNENGDLIALGFDSNTISLYHTMNK
jgi:hypothetical protein